jgi:Protein of unknown function (DUF2950)
VGEAVEMPAGNTIHNIVAERHIVTVRPQTGLAARHEVTPWLTARLALDNNSAARAAILPAIVPALASATELAVGWAGVIGSAVGGQTALEAETSPGVEEETETHSEEVPGVLADTTDPARVPTAAAAPPAWDPEGEGSEAEVGVVAVAGADERRLLRRVVGSSEMKRMHRNPNLRFLWGAVVIACALFLSALVLAAARQSATKAAPASTGMSAKMFNTPQQAADELIEAAEKFDVHALEEIFGSAGDDIVLSGEYPQDRQRATDFAAEAREKKNVSVDPKKGNRAFLLVGNEDWPFPVPLVKLGDKWYFDAKAGRQELLYRRIGANELDAIAICYGYVEAQHEYAFQKREGYDVNQYAQRIISTPGKQDGLAWQNPDGSWGGPIGEKIARAIEQGYSPGAEPYHGYFFKILKGQGPAAPLGQMDYVVKGVMIGGFALVAAPAEYGETGVKTFIVSHDGVVYEKDPGPKTLDEFQKMERFNPDKSWTPVTEKDE